MKLHPSRRNPSNNPEVEAQQRTPKRIQSMYVNNPHVRLGENRARRPRTRPPTVHLMPNVPFPNEDDKVHRDTNEEKILSEFFSTQHETENPR
ncbi:hypothetical protein X801_07064 [Opisthorchis viverrini]|uniref:Uncharacterized protein n=1 Tax=Opisthorchis viverrini TaxID=6198 RepID=A0A1S8WS02_OPIVI|nr:hypothetical protein X801_07064 [Opisthorchis viverrini]